MRRIRHHHRRAGKPQRRLGTWAVLSYDGAVILIGFHFGIKCAVAAKLLGKHSGRRSRDFVCIDDRAKRVIETDNEFVYPDGICSLRWLWGITQLALIFPRLKNHFTEKIFRPSRVHSRELVMF
jgi:hypothetical protein